MSSNRSRRYTNMDREVRFVKAHGELNTYWAHTVPRGSSVSFLVPLGAQGFGFRTRNSRGVPSARFNERSDPNAILRAFKKKRPIKNVRTLISRDTGFRPIVYESNENIPGFVITNDDQNPSTSQLKAPFIQKVTRAGKSYNRGNKIKRQALISLMRNKPGNYIVHACRSINASNRSRCDYDMYLAKNENRRQYKYRRNDLRTTGIEHRKQRKYNVGKGWSVPYLEQPQRRSTR